MKKHNTKRCSKCIRYNISKNKKSKQAYKQEQPWKEKQQQQQFKEGTKRAEEQQKESVLSKESNLVQQCQQYHHPLDLEVDLDAEIRLKKLSTVEEIKEYAVELST